MSNHYDNFQMPNNLNHQHHSHHNNHNDNSTFSLNDHSDSSFTPNHSSLFSNSNDIINANPNNSSSSSGVVKETGIIEKMLVSYGFIQCCERQARLFFHFSQYLGNTDHLKIGDPVEYEMSYDRRTGKPVAINIRKITSDDFMTKLIRTERVSGVIATEPATSRGEGRVAFENGGEFFFLPFTQEDILENVTLKAKDKVSFIIVTDDSGNYRAKDINLELAGAGGGGSGGTGSVGSGGDGGRPNSASGIRCQGTISSIKDTFGFIERADTSANIFFHSSDCANFKALNVGENVEFVVTSRKSKELASSVTKVAFNSVEEVSETVYKGQIVKYTPRPFNISASASLGANSGKINCIELNKELPFTDKDVKGFFTLANYDLVSFQICTDRRNGAQRACNITFMPESFTLNSEVRERGYVASLKETYGFIKCPSKEGSLIYFKLTEVIDYANPLKLNDEVEFTYNTDPQTRKFQANRISTLPNGTLFNILPRGANSNNNNSSKSGNNSSSNNGSNLENNNFPLIDLSSDLDSQMVIGSGNNKSRGGGLANGNAAATAAADVWQQLQENNANNKVPMQLETLVASASSGHHHHHHNYGHHSPSNAARNHDAFGGGGGGNSDLYHPQNSSSIFSLNGSGGGGGHNSGQSEGSGLASAQQSNGEYYSGSRAVGFVVAVKESYCFIESLDGENEYFGHQSSYLDPELLDQHPLEMGQTVEFTAAYVNGKWKATEIRRTRGAPVAMYEGELSDLCTGIVLRTIQMFNGDQAEYCGLVARTDQLQTLEIDLAEAERSIEERYEFSMTSFKFLKDYIAVGDMVKFQVGTAPGTGKRRAYNVEVLRERIKGSIYVMSRMYGFVKADIENESRKVYFNRGEVVGSPRLKVGDLVDFYLVDNKKSDKCYAIDIVKLESAPGDGSAAGGGGGGSAGPGPDGDGAVSVPRFKNLQMAKDKAESGPKVVVIRQPRAPDGTKGFSAHLRNSAAAADDDTESTSPDTAENGGTVGQ